MSVAPSETVSGPAAEVVRLAVKVLRLSVPLVTAKLVFTVIVIPNVTVIATPYTIRLLYVVYAIGKVTLDWISIVPVPKAGPGVKAKFAAVHVPRMINPPPFVILK